MKIVYISRSIIPSRTANSVNVMRMCNAFAKLGHNVTLLAPLTKKLEEKDINNIFTYYGVEENFVLKKLYSPNIKYLKKRIYSLRCLNEIKKIEPGLVYGRDDMYSFYLASKQGYNVVFERHEPIGQNKFNDFFLKKMIVDMKNVRFVFNSGALKEMYHMKFGVENSRMLAAHNGANEVLNEDLPTKVKIDMNKIHVGYIGTLFKGRGIDIIIELSKRFSDVIFHIVGGKDKDIKYWKKEANFDNLIFHGFVPPQEAYKYRNMCNILLAPYQTDNEGNRSSKYMSPIKLFEYMSSQKAIITSNLDVVHEFLSNEQNVLLVESSNIDEWEIALKRLIEDVHLRNLIAAQAYKDFLKNHTWKSRVQKILKFIENTNVK